MDKDSQCEVRRDLQLAVDILNQLKLANQNIGNMTCHVRAMLHK